MSKIPGAYKHTFLLSELQNDDLIFIQTDYDLSFWLEFTGLPNQWRKDITGGIIKIFDGDLLAAWFTENYAPYLLNTPYHSLPYYLNYELNRRFKKLPYYWQYENTHYHHNHIQNTGE